jgi:hypothetical protein
LDWFEQAKKDYIPGVFGYKKIAKKYGLPVKTVESRFLQAKKRGEISGGCKAEIEYCMIHNIDFEIRSDLAHLPCVE